MILAERVAHEVLHVRFEDVDALDAANADAVKAEVLGKIDGRSDLVIDLQGVSFVDSAGVASLVGIFKAAHVRGRSVRFARISPEVAAVLRIVKLDEIFDLHPDVDSAVRAVRRSVLGGAGR